MRCPESSRRGTGAPRAGARGRSGIVAGRADPASPAPGRARGARPARAEHPACPTGRLAPAHPLLRGGRVRLSGQPRRLLVPRPRRSTPTTSWPPSARSAWPGPTTSSSTSSGPSTSTSSRRCSQGARYLAVSLVALGFNLHPARGAGARRDARGARAGDRDRGGHAGELPAQPPLVLPVARMRSARRALVALLATAALAAPRRPAAAAAEAPARAVGEPTPAEAHRGGGRPRRSAVADKAGEIQGGARRARPSARPASLTDDEVTAIARTSQRAAGLDRRPRRSPARPSTTTPQDRRPHLLRGQQERDGKETVEAQVLVSDDERRDHRGAHRPAGGVDDGPRLRRRLRAGDQPSRDLARRSARSSSSPLLPLLRPAVAGLVAHARPAGAAVVQRLADLVQRGARSSPRCRCSTRRWSTSALRLAWIAIARVRAARPEATARGIRRGARPAAGARPSAARRRPGCS